MKLPWSRPSGPSAVPEGGERATPPPPPAPLDLEPELRPLRAAVETLSARADLHDSDLEDIRDQLDRVAARIDRLTQAVAEGIEHVDRSERRVKATAARARKELQDSGLESPGLEAEWAQLRERDGEGGENGGMQPVREGVAGDPSRVIEVGDSFPGAWTEGDLASMMRDAG